MHKKTIAGLPLIIFALVNPTLGHAKDSNRSITYHLSTATNLSPAFDKILSPLIDKEISGSKTVDVQVDLPEAPYHARLLSGANSPKEKSFDYNWDGGAISFSTLRTKSLRNIYGSKLSGINRFSVAEAKMGIVEEVGPHDRLAFSTSYALERRRPSLFLGRHSTYRSQDIAFTTSWTHDDQLSLSISGFDIRPNKTRGNIERMVELGGGAPLAVRGVALTASLSPTHVLQRLSVSFDVRQQKHSTTDAAVIGALTDRNETRWALILHRRF